MTWSINIHRQAEKQIRKLPNTVKATLFLLIRDLTVNGPSTSGIWKNYGKLRGTSKDKRHCHIIKGKPTYVCCWEVINKQIKIVEIYYVGTHENAPYA